MHGMIVSSQFCQGLFVDVLPASSQGLMLLEWYHLPNESCGHDLRWEYRDPSWHSKIPNIVGEIEFIHIHNINIYQPLVGKSFMVFPLQTWEVLIFWSRHQGKDWASQPAFNCSIMRSKRRPGTLEAFEVLGRWRQAGLSPQFQSDMKFIWGSSSEKDKMKLQTMLGLAMLEITPAACPMHKRVGWVNISDVNHKRFRIWNYVTEVTLRWFTWNLMRWFLHFFWRQTWLVSNGPPKEVPYPNTSATWGANRQDLCDVLAVDSRIPWLFQHKEWCVNSVNSVN